MRYYLLSIENDLIFIEGLQDAVSCRIYIPPLKTSSNFILLDIPPKPRNPCP